MRARREKDVFYWLDLFAVDLLFVLLINLVIIICITPILPVPAFIDFASSTTAQKSPEVERDITISVLRDGRIFLEDELLGAATLRQRLTTMHAGAQREVTVRLRVDRATPFADVRRVVKAAAQAGYPRLTFMVRAIE